MSTLKRCGSLTSHASLTFEMNKFGWVTAIACSPDESRLASGSNNGTVQLWDWATGICVREFKGQSIMVTSLAFSADGSHVQARYYRTGSTVVWNTTTGERVENEDWENSYDHHECEFKLKDGKLYREGSREPERLLCFLPASADAQYVVSYKLREGADIVAINCGTGCVIILRVQLS